MLATEFDGVSALGVDRPLAASRIVTASTPTGRPVPIPAPRRHPPEDAFERTYEAVLARGAGADLDDLGKCVGRFRANAEGIRDEPDRRRWSAFVGGLEGAVLALRAQAPERAERELRRGLRAFIRATRARSQ